MGKAYTFTATKENKTSKTKQNIGTLMVKNETKQHKHTHAKTKTCSPSKKRAPRCFKCKFPQNYTSQNKCKTTHTHAARNAQNPATVKK